MKKQTRKRKKSPFQYFLKHMGQIFFVLLLIGVLVNFIAPDRSFSEKENRVLSSRPKASLSLLASGRYSSQYETYVNDQFIFRDMWVEIKANIDRLLGQTEKNGVYLGKDGYLIEDFTPPSMETLDTLLTSIQGFSKRHPEIQQYALIAPNAVSIYKEKLPAFSPVEDQNIYLDYLKAGMESSNIDYIDIRPILNEHSDEHLYYRTDHHWTTQSAYYAYQEAAKVMRIDSGLYSYEQLTVTGTFQGTLSAKSGFRSNIKEKIDVFLPEEGTPASLIKYIDEQINSGSFYATKQLEGRDKYAMFFNGNHPLIKIETPLKDNQKVLLVLKDSYANCLVPFLAPHYRTIIMVDPRYYYDNLEELITVEGVNEILYLYNANTFFSDTSLELTLAEKTTMETISETSTSTIQA